MGKLRSRRNIRVVGVSHTNVAMKPIPLLCWDNKFKMKKYFGVSCNTFLAGNSSSDKLLPGSMSSSMFAAGNS